jgi:hypothetical protein
MYSLDDCVQSGMASSVCAQLKDRQWYYRCRVDDAWANIDTCPSDRSQQARQIDVSAERCGVALARQRGERPVALGRYAQECRDTGADLACMTNLLQGYVPLDQAQIDCGDPLRHCAWEEWTDADLADSAHTFSSFPALLRAQTQCMEIGPHCVGVTSQDGTGTYDVRVRADTDAGAEVVHRPMSRAWVPPPGGCAVWAARREENRALQAQAEKEEASRQSAVDLSIQKEFLSELQRANQALVANIDSAKRWRRNRLH